MQELIEPTSYSTSDFDSEFFTCGKYTSIAGGCRLHGPDNHPWVTDHKCVTNYPFGDKNPDWDFPRSSGKGKVHIGNDVWIGEGVRILSGVKIGDGAIIGAGALVSKDVPDYSVVVGNPGRVVKFRFSKHQIKVLQRVKWWSWSDEEVRQNIKYIANINLFMEKYA
jgi:virginiamycin A acetyltransferase